MAHTSRGDYLLSREDVDLHTVKSGMQQNDGLFDEDGNIEGGDEDLFGNRVNDRGGNARDRANLVLSDSQ
jgi:hypothetical protein